MRVQDIQNTEQTLYYNYIQYFLNGQYLQARRILNREDFRSKAFNNITINNANNDVFNLEKLYYTNVEDNLADKLLIFNTAIINLFYKDAYDTSKEYSKGNFVLYDNAVYVYISEVSTNNVPTDGRYWLFLGLKQDGAPGLGLKLKYQYSSTVQYNEKDAVIYNNNMYWAKKDNQGVIPGTDNSVWELLFESVKAKIYVSKVPPANLYRGLLWFEVLD